MASIPLSSFLGSAATVVSGLMKGQAAGEAQAAEEAQQQQEQAARLAQQKAQQEQFAQTMQLDRDRLAAEERHRMEEERLRGVDIERKSAADRFKQQNAGTINAGKADIAKARDWRQAQEFAATKKQAALNRYYQTAPNLSQADRDAMWEATQDEISQYEAFAGTFSSPYAVAGQAPTGGEAPGTAPAAGAPAAGTPSVAPKPAPGRLTAPTPKQIAEQKKIAQTGQRITDTEEERKKRHEERAGALKEEKRYHDILAGGRSAALSSIDRHRRVMEQITRERAARGPRGSDPKVAALRDATKLETLFADPKKWPAMAPPMRQAMLDRYQRNLQVLGEKMDPNIQKYIHETVGEAQAISTKGGLSSEEKYDRRQALKFLTAKEVIVPGTPPQWVHDPGTPQGLQDRAPEFAILWSKATKNGRTILQRQFPQDYQHYLQSQPQPAAKPTPAPAAAPAPAPRAAGGLPALPSATGVSVPPPPPPPPGAQPQRQPRTQPQRQPRTQPPPKTKQTQTGTVRPPANFDTEQGVKPPKGEDPAVWKAVRQMKPPYPKNTGEWQIWQLLIGKGWKPQDILSLTASHDPQNLDNVKATLHDINQNYLSGPRAAQFQKAAGEGATKGTKRPSAPPRTQPSKYDVNRIGVRF